MKRFLLLVVLLSLVLFSSLTVAIINRQDEPKPITLAEFNRRIAEKNKTILVYFHADWCVVCRKMEPVMQRVDSLYKSRLEILNIDTERDKEITEELEIDALPIFMIYRNGTRHWTHFGILTEKELTEKLNLYVLPAVN